MDKSIYEPAEDSFLLLDCLNKELDNQTKETQIPIEERNVYLLDVGAGSGFIGFEAAKKGCHVVSVDINPDAVEFMKKNKPNDDVKIIESDLFENVDTFNYDFIVFNTPYLPNDEEFHDDALHGGNGGYEISLRFLKEARHYMYDDSVILMLISTLTKPKIIELFMMENKYKFEIVGTKKEFMEELLVYRITKA
ncbi:MAG: HemK2/MTQ2 family protein methyltransferase [Candidatus Woesearchaeota archaeon]